MAPASSPSAQQHGFGAASARCSSPEAHARTFPSQWVAGTKQGTFCDFDAANGFHSLGVSVWPLSLYPDPVRLQPKSACELEPAREALRAADLMWGCVPTLQDTDLKPGNPCSNMGATKRKERARSCMVAASSRHAHAHAHARALSLHPAPHHARPHSLYGFIALLFPPLLAAWL